MTITRGVNIPSIDYIRIISRHRFLTLSQATGVSGPDSHTNININCENCNKCDG